MCERHLNGNKMKWMMAMTGWLMTGVFFSPAFGFAHNLDIKNVILTGQNTGADTTLIQFDISWGFYNRDSENWDAAWVFAKYSTDNGGTWSHATLKTSGTNPSGFSTGSGTSIEIVVPSDKKGCFIQSSSTASGTTLSTTSIQLVWDYAADGLTDEQAALGAAMKVFGIEMIYVPQASFYVGDGKNNATDPEAAFYDGGSGSYGSLQLTTDSAVITLGGTTTGNLATKAASTGFDDDFTSVATKTLPDVFPKGVNAFYMMRYELTQGQYVDFLNTLSRSAQNQRVGSTVSADTIPDFFVMAGQSNIDNTDRNQITAPSAGNGTTARIRFTARRPDRAANYVSWADMAAYADWAALRPLTELEYEKAARGPNTAAADEFAWGRSLGHGGTTFSSSAEDGTEIFTTASAKMAVGNVIYTGGDGSAGPVRVGITGRSLLGTSRIGTGGGYYGNMDLSGNVQEFMVSVGNSRAREFTGTHGDGALTTTTSYEGNATNSDWPGFNTISTNHGVQGNVEPVGGVAWRGGTAIFASQYARLSDRHWANVSASNSKQKWVGGRLGRTAPG